MQFIRLSHCVYHCEYHLVIVTKYRRKIFNKGVFVYLETKLAEITDYYPQIKFRKINHDEDHLHLLISVPPTMASGKAVNIIKTNTARGIKKKFPFIKDVYWGTDSIWSEGYFVTTVGADETVIRKYIEDQGKKDLGQTLFKV